MLFYDCATAPSPRRVRIFLAEKGISIPTVQVDLRHNEHLQEAFAAINPEQTVPALLLDSGTVLTDAIAICVYFEETHPEPALIGRSAEERAVTISWNRRVERDGFYAVMEAFRNATPGLKGRALPGAINYEQIPALAERGRTRVQHFFTWMDQRLAESAFAAGPHYTIADITTLVTVEFARWAKLPIPASCANLHRWLDGVSARPSAKA